VHLEQLRAADGELSALQEVLEVKAGTKIAI
jgi:hypothetical protein